MAARVVHLNIPLHKAGTRVQLVWWPSGRLIKLVLGNKEATLDRRSATLLRDALSQYLDNQQQGAPR